MGEHILKKIIAEKKIENIEVRSAGIDGNSEYRIYGYLAELMAEKGIDFSKHISTKITGKHLIDYDLIIVMERLQKKYISHRYPWAMEKVRMLKELTGEGSVDVPDPMGRADEAYKLVFDEINACVNKIAAEILKQ